MRTKKDFDRLNYNEYAFFKGIPTMDAKWEFTEHVFPSEWRERHETALKENRQSVYLTSTGNPRITASEKVDYDKLDFTMRSNSKLDGKCQLKYLCDYYNKGVSLHKLSEYSENKVFIKALGFTGKNAVLSEILNRDQLRKLQETWLLKNTYGKHSISDNCIKFILTNDWAKTYLQESPIDVNMIEEEIKSYKSRKDKSKAKKGYSFQAA